VKAAAGVDSRFEGRWGSGWTSDVRFTRRACARGEDDVNPTTTANRPTVDGRHTRVDFLTTRRIVEVVLTVVLGVSAGLLYYASDFGLGMVHDQLSAQDISFPPAGPALSPAEYPGLQRYAGQKVDSGPKAKAYADQYIRHHLGTVAGGQKYAEVSAKSRANPTDATLARQRTTLFEGETLRGLLLFAWGWSVVNTIGHYAALALFGAFLLMLLLTVADFALEGRTPRTLGRSRGSRSGSIVEGAASDDLVSSQAPTPATT
jgi:hypothetical protein